MSHYDKETTESGIVLNSLNSLSPCLPISLSPKIKRNLRQKLEKSSSSQNNIVLIAFKFQK